MSEMAGLKTHVLAAAERGAVGQEPAGSPALAAVRLQQFQARSLRPRQCCASPDVFSAWLQHEAQRRRLEADSVPQLRGYCCNGSGIFNIMYTMGFRYKQVDLFLF